MIKKIDLLIKRSKQFQEAIIYYDQSLQFNPQNPELLEGKGYFPFEFSYLFIKKTIGFNTEAVPLYQQALKYDPFSAEILKGLGFIHNQLIGASLFSSQLQTKSIRNLHQYNEAITFFERALEINPNSSVSYRGKAECLRLLRKWDEALVNYTQALRYDTRQFEAAYFKSQLLQSQILLSFIAQLEYIIQQLRNHEQNLSINPQNFYSIFGKAECLILQFLLFNKQDCQMIMKKLKNFMLWQQILIPNIIIHSQDMVQAQKMKNLGWCLTIKNKIKEALDQYNKALKINEYAVDAIWGKGYILKELQGNVYNIKRNILNKIDEGFQASFELLQESSNFISQSLYFIKWYRQLITKYFS